ncbi:hypothetical protein ACFORH_39055 [Amycolatopsis roodepoortensis]|uniref:Uncharacterized protein n=1 Tax=Amycolatopsis roodepoortensis TaxID=700274 RepID=A0ABR9LIK8_9PSEU|nr:hypothetical protein [Amycolatopsis roodepoortensis]MBE1580514.1 hypothetical protein [Amycolatopsis roodepoortensis]
MRNLDDLDRVEEVTRHAPQRSSDLDGRVLAQLITDAGFRMGTKNRSLHDPATLVQVNVLRDRVRVRFPSPDAHYGVGLVDLPQALTLGVIAHVVIALNEYAAAHRATAPTLERIRA